MKSHPQGWLFYILGGIIWVRMTSLKGLTLMKDCQSRFHSWLSDPFFDEDTKAELVMLRDTDEIEDRFCKDLEFGTAGLRGVMQAGTNRMNRYTVRRATKGLAMWLNSTCDDLSGGVVIAYDTRNNSADFALETALTLCGEGVLAYLFNTYAPTPLLSFAVRHLGCLAGVMITASHNPREYNGYKAFDKDGCQLLPDDAAAVLSFIKETPMTSAVPMDKDAALKSGLLRMVGGNVLDAFLAECKKQTHPISDEAKGALRVVYSPLNGAGLVPVCRILSEQGYKNVTVVGEQAEPNGDFPTLNVPNPEDPEALSMGIRLAGVKDADLVLATDPDCDRLAIAVLHDGFYQTISGNTLGALIVNYVLTRRADTLSSDSFIVKSVVTGELGASVAESFGVTVKEVLTGFKYIGDYIRGSREGFVMGYEESCGYLIGSHVLDKDAVVTSLIVCEMAAYYKQQGKTLLNVLDELYEQFGVHMFCVDAYNIPGLDWSVRVQHSMSALRERGGDIFEDTEHLLDYQNGIDGLPATDMLKYIFADGSWLCVRPSGTEPKLKIYHFSRYHTSSGACEIIAAHRKTIERYLPEGAKK